LSGVLEPVTAGVAKDTHRVATSSDHLRQVLAIAQANGRDLLTSPRVSNVGDSERAQCHDTHIDNELKTLEEGSNMAENTAAGALCEIGVGSHRVLVRVKTKEKSPKEQARVGSDDAH
jgi:hypothetical protein